MRSFLIFCLVLYVCIFVPSNGRAQTRSAGSRPNTTEDESLRNALGKRFLKSVRSSKADDYVACWLGYEEMEAALSNLPPGAPKPSAEQLKQIKAYVEKRDKLIRVSYLMLRRGIAKECGDLSSLTVSDVIVSNISEMQGKTVASSIEIVLLTSGKRKVAYRVDDGALLDGKWYFSDKPAAMFTITLPNGKTENKLLSDYATAEETETLKALMR